ncbi:hypothetical protein BD779DRAFT_1065745 [Infundibulicybe gibba]|nr:hypothetical protein BD779DRAFT_1065745 [Infundibulicybe gibba]
MYLLVLTTSYLLAWQLAWCGVGVARRRANLKCIPADPRLGPRLVSAVQVIRKRGRDRYQCYCILGLVPTTPAETASPDSTVVRTAARWERMTIRAWDPGATLPPSRYVYLRRPALFHVPRPTAWPAAL